MIAVNQIKIRVDIAWGILFRFCARSTQLDRWLTEAERIAVEQEREHRAMGKRFTDGQSKYRVSVHHAARAIIIGQVYRGYGQGTGTKAPESWSDACSVRADCALAYAIREHLPGDKLAELASAAEIDYARDIAA
jgi:hypothetical protein